MQIGYNPRVLLFSMRSDAPANIPLSILNDHSFGVQSVAFSDDSNWLCSLGSSYDGFLLLYSVNSTTGGVRLHSSNKCTNVHNIMWMGDSVVSIGTRHVKVWRIERGIPPAKGRSNTDSATDGVLGSPGPRIFHGRNCILGSLIDATFACAVALSDCKALLCSTQGEICLLDDSDKAQRLEKVLQLSFGIYCVHFDQGASILWFGGKNGQLASMTLADLSKSSRSELQSNAVSVLSLQENSRILAVGSVRNCLVTIDSDRVIDLRRLQSEQDRFIALKASKRLSAHESAVLGVCSLLHWHERGELDFLTYSARGTVLMWNFDGVCCGRIEIAIDQPQQQIDIDPNELKIVVVSGYDRLLYAGDKMGILR